MMTFSEAEKFNEFLEECFGEGVTIRELRLSNEETEYIRKIYPKASFNKNQSTEAPDGKAWYKVVLKPPINTKEKIWNAEKMATIQKENAQLKQELESLKKYIKLNGK